jgi:hypothetical protein
MNDDINEIATRETWKNIPIKNPQRIFIELVFSEEQYMKIKNGLIPQEMEDKWFIFFENNWLYFHRSWTGFGIYKAEIKRNNEKYCINEFYVEHNKEKYACDNENEDIDNFTFLIAWGLLNVDAREIFFKNNISNEKETIKSWSNFGSLMIAKRDIELYNSKNEEIDNIYDSFNIAGFSFCDRNVIVEELEVGFELKLITESNNKHDKYAVAIYYGEHKLGYIPMKKNKNISQFINLGHNDIFEAKISKIKETDNLEEKINVIITIKNKKGVDFV